MLFVNMLTTLLNTCV